MRRLLLAAILTAACGSESEPGGDDGSPPPVWTEASCGPGVWQVHITADSSGECFPPGEEDDLTVRVDQDLAASVNMVIDSNADLVNAAAEFTVDGDFCVMVFTFDIVSPEGRLENQVVAVANQEEVLSGSAVVNAFDNDLVLICSQAFDLDGSYQ